MTKAKSREWYVVYHNRDPGDPAYKWTRWLKPGFRHVELTYPVRFGTEPDQQVWINVLPTMETLDVEISTDPRSPRMKCPQSTVQKVISVLPEGKLRSRFDIGPPNCVEVAKMVLGINAFFVRTPWQLYQYIAKRDGILCDSHR